MLSIASSFSGPLQCGNDQIWHSEQSTAVSYPTEGHTDCFAVEDGSYWFAHRNRVITQLLDRHAIDGPFLDVGGGNGVVSAAIARTGRCTVMLEPGIAGARNAKARGLPHVICATLKQAAPIAGVFRAVGLFDVIEHVQDDVALLRETRSLLPAGGHLLVTVPALPTLWSDEDVYAGHYRRYTLSECANRIQAAGFRIDFASYFFAPLVLPVLIARRMRSALARRNTQALHETAVKQLQPDAFTNRLIRALLAAEYNMLSHARVPIGTSCAIVATADEVAA